MKINIEITGITPLLMHRFVENAKDDKNITPRESAIKFAYIDEVGKLYLPTCNIFACIIAAGGFHKLGKNKVTTQKSSLIPAGMIIENEVTNFIQPDDFEVDSRSVVIPSTGGRVMMHRPRLDKWVLPFTLSVDTKMFSSKFTREIVDDAGQKIGLGDFRPARKGIYGRFKVTKWQEEKD